jgi:hypothetical protein
LWTADGGLTVQVDRRDFLLLRAGEPAVLSCERLFMRFLDSQMDGTTATLFEHLADDLRRVTTVRLTDTAWLSRADLKAQMDPILDSFTARGGQVL